MSQIKLNFYNVRVNVKANPDFLKNIVHDYSFFVDNKFNSKVSPKTRKNKTSCDVTFNIFTKIKENLIPNLKASAYHQDYIIYETKRTRYIDFHGSCICIYEKDKKIFNIFSKDEVVLYEVFHLFLMTIVGDLLDKKGLHRIHCLSLKDKNKSCLILMPMGAGKTTLALKFIENNSEIKVISDDIAITDGKKIYPFPIRIGVRTEQLHSINTKHKRLFKRSKESDKFLIDITKLYEIEKKTVEPCILMIGKRVNNDKCIIKRSSFSKVFFHVFKSAVLGLELPQALAIFLSNFWGNIKKTNTFSKRFFAIYSIISKSKIYTIELGFNHQKNYEVLSDFLKINL